MISLIGFIRLVRKFWRSADVRYIHPSLYIIIVDESFDGLTEERRLDLVLDKLGLAGDVASRLFVATNIAVCAVTSDERRKDLDFIDESPSGHHWIEFLAGAVPRPPTRPVTQRKFVHFYGYKGGQGRSTVLTMLSKSLADDGYRVLAVDADIEAPSLHSQFDLSIDILEATLLGCTQYSLKPNPQQVYLGRSSSGSVDMIACKPSGPDYNLDLAVFALNTALNPTILQDGFRNIAGALPHYDVILVDHRSGISSSVLPLIAEFPGPTAVCVRLDEQSDEADEYIRILLDRNPEMPGLFVSFSLDPEDTIEKLRDRSGARIEALLDILGSSIDAGAVRNDGEEASETPPDLLRSYWVSWFHDRSFLTKLSPLVQDTLSVNQDALRRIRETTGFASTQRPLVQPTTTADFDKTLTNSGNTDEGVLIQTDALRRLRSPNSPYRYVFGRKGTGKTRLVRALIDEGHGAALLTAEDSLADTSISSANPNFVDLSELLFRQQAPDKLWLVILDCALKSPARDASDSLKGWYERLREHGSSEITASDIVDQIQKVAGHRTFLIDGVETAFTSSQMPLYVRSLFRFLAFVQSNPNIANKITIRLFLRTDLAQFATENVEQQVDGRRLTLSWDTQFILNFALSRIAALNWFRSTFADVVNEIDLKSAVLAEGGVSIDECSDILMRVFPPKYKRNNLLTLTFLKTYFSEGEGETATYYPRIYDAFLRGIDNPELISSSAARIARLEDGLVGQQLMVRAHDYASAQYLEQVAAELRNLIQLADNPEDNRRRVDALLPSFRGLPTPFEVGQCLDRVHEKLSTDYVVDKELVKSALDQMKRVGIFEDRPGWGGWWRAGRLFKNSLGMKYVR